MKTEPITREQVVRDIAKGVSLWFGLPLDSRNDVEDVIGEAMPTFEVIADAHALATEPNTNIIRPRLVTAMRELGEEGVETIGIIVSYAGSTVDLFPGEEWTAIASCDPIDDSEGTDARGVGATCRAALEACASEVYRMEAEHV